MNRAGQIRVEGTVQGVGFRPFVYRLAHQHRLTGWTRNDTRGVDIFIQGAEKDTAAFLEELKSTAPPLARITRLISDEVAPDSTITDFQILESACGEAPMVDIARDTSICFQCLEEMNNPADRRFGHPFINCTNCGPRYTIIQKLPYDRPGTTMADFEMCAACRKEYEDPSTRRFHAQPVSCPDCGPQLSLGEGLDDPLETTIAALRAGKIVAVKGLGGFHLCCCADNEEAVQQLRCRKGREARPFALMVRDAKTASQFAEVSPKEAELLESIERPIVVVQALEKKRCAPSVAPGVNTLGIMLPYTPLHALLFSRGGFDALVMTSGNVSGLPLCKDNNEAMGLLKGMADVFLLHDRAIQTRLDDSIVRVLGGEPVLLRRARGYVPAPLPAPFDVDGLVALGGIMKSTVCVGRGQTAYVSQYIGTLENIETLEHMEATLNHLMEVLGVDPMTYVLDRHPGGFQNYLLPKGGLNEPVRIQHHHAHAAACLAENEVREPTLCFVFDGLGLGDDGTLWGGEILMSDLCGSRRLGHLELLDLPGGDAATRYPGRIAYAALSGLVSNADLNRVLYWLSSNDRKPLPNQPRTSSIGRLFDAVSALLNVCHEQTYEGQAAMELEAIVDPNVTGHYEVEPVKEDGLWLLPGKALLIQIFQALENGEERSAIAAKFHRTLARWIAAVARQESATRVGLSGGCFQNRLLFEWTRSALEEQGVEVLVHRRLSPGDECISYGQLITAGARRANRKNKEMNACV
ncbi:carbamoyltransferase HypF [Pontiellaceae bacterium B12227]|nr:carbamoyltransferase HypF [Pontiellaceae bacterium B12227]